MLPPDFLVPFSPLDLPAPLVSSSSLALRQDSQSPARHLSFTSVLKAHDFTSACQLCPGSAVPWLHHGPTAIGLLRSPSSLISHCSASATDFRVSETLDPFSSSGLLFPSGFPIVLTPSVVASVSRSNGSTLAVKFALQFEFPIA